MNRQRLNVFCGWERGFGILEEPKRCARQERLRTHGWNLVNSSFKAIVYSYPDFKFGLRFLALATHTSLSENGEVLMLSRLSIFRCILYLQDKKCTYVRFEVLTAVKMSVFVPGL
jgi:hypothetical protein